MFEDRSLLTQKGWTPTMRYLIAALSVATSMLLPAFCAQAQVSVGINAGGVSIGINMPTYPDLVQVPGYPVYYDPQADSNYFFYDGLYWVFDGNAWYESTWYNGPWDAVDDQDVPLFVLRVPVRYYRRPPDFFRGWSADAPPRWGDHWGNSWQSRHQGWDNWDRKSVPALAPLPIYQRQYTGNRYPRAAQQQRTIETQNYHYQPHEAITRQRFQTQAAPARTATQPPRTRPQAQIHTKPAAAPRVVKPAEQAEQKPNAEPAHKGRAPVNQEHRVAPVTRQAKPAQVNVQPKAHVQPVHPAQPSGQARPATQAQHPGLQAQEKAHAPQGEPKARAAGGQAAQPKGGQGKGESPRGNNGGGGGGKGGPQEKGNDKNEQHG
ncbi:MAG: hypothetical protein ABI294_10110 [Casimicrobiaceae bacterium]